MDALVGRCTAASVSSNKLLFAFVTVSIDRPKIFVLQVQMNGWKIRSGSKSC